MWAVTATPTISGYTKFLIACHMTSVLITFALAYLGYVLLCVDVVLHASRRPLRLLTLAMLLVVVVHVGMVWGLRFGWSLEMALSKGWTGFIAFHVALVILIAASISAEPWSGRLLLIAFPIITLGAIVASFKYDFVAIYRWPLVIAALATTIIALSAWRSGRRRDKQLAPDSAEG